MGRSVREGRRSHRHPELGEEGEVVRGEGRLLFPGGACGSPLMSNMAETNGKCLCGPQPHWGSGLVKQQLALLQLSGSLRIRKGKKKKDSKYSVYF